MGNSDFNVGDLVQLLSGSPEMTVIGQDGTDTHVIYATERGEILQAYIPTKALMFAASE